MKSVSFFVISLLVILVSLKVSECILLGKNATGDFSYAVAFRERTGDKIINCGGAILSKSCILTSAVCAQWIKGKNLSLHYGSIYLSNGLTLDVKKVIQHPQYNANTRTNDIAVVIPAADIKLSDEARPVNLPTSDHPSQGGVSAKISGWGVSMVNNYIWRATIKIFITMKPWQTV